MMGPILKRYIAIAGLLGLIPVGYLLIIGRLTVADAGIRSAVMIVAVFVLRKLFGNLGKPVPKQPQRRAADQTAA